MTTTPPVPAAPPPHVSIGMPVFNGAATLRPAIESLLEQTFEDFELVISDNASDDETEEICGQYEALDSRIRYVRHPKNMGAAVNFEYVLREARGEYFMWAAADDTRSPDYVAVNLRFLESHPDFVASTSPVRFAGRVPDGRAMGDKSLDQTTPEARFLAFFEAWHANGRFYSLFRREPLLTIPDMGAPPYLGSDWMIVLRLLRRWRFHRSAAGELVLGTGGLSNSTEVFRAQRSSALELVVPFWKLTVATMRLTADMRTGIRVRLLVTLLRRNYQALVAQSKYAVRRRTRPT